MASRKLEDRLEQLRQLRAAAELPDAALRKALQDRSNLMVAEAAKIVAEHKRAELIPDLLSVFDRLFENPARSDPRCWAKTAIVKALTSLDYGESPPFIRASQHIQMEPVWGGQEDAAVDLRANAILALAQCTDLSRAEVLRRLVDALADAADPVRIEAVRALEQMNGEEAALLLRLKAYAGDRRPQVIGQVFDSLLHLESERAVSFVARFLKSENHAICDEAAGALGGSRLRPAILILIQAWQENENRGLKSTLLRALSASRHEEGFKFLLDLVSTGGAGDCAAALKALDIYNDWPELQERIRDAQRRRSTPCLGV